MLVVCVLLLVCIWFVCLLCVCFILLSDVLLCLMVVRFGFTCFAGYYLVLVLWYFDVGFGVWVYCLWLLIYSGCCVGC